MSKLALLIGINEYDNPPFDPLECCEYDAEEMGKLLSHDWAPEGKGAPNYNTRVYTSAGNEQITTAFLREKVTTLMRQSMGDGKVLFYFSGHGYVDERGGFLVTQDGTKESPGFPMSELLETANASGNTSAIIILDCCYGGAIGNETHAGGFSEVSIGQNVTVLAGSSSQQHSAEGFDHSLFTELLIEGLEGGAADPRGEVHAAALYSYLDQSLGPWDQRPVYKSYARRLDAIRRDEPAVPDEILARLTDWFPSAGAKLDLAPSYVREDDSAQDEHVAVFEQLKLLRNSHLLKHSSKDLYWTALESGNVSLTPHGRLFWRRARRDEFWR